MINNSVTDPIPRPKKTRIKRTNTQLSTKMFSMINRDQKVANKNANNMTEAKKINKKNYKNQ